MRLEFVFSVFSVVKSYLLVGIQGRTPLGYIAGRLSSANTANIFIFQMLIIFDRCLYLWQTFPKPHLPNLIKICGDICCYFPQYKIWKLARDPVLCKQKHYIIIEKIPFCSLKIYKEDGVDVWQVPKQLPGSVIV